ncbi:six-cysteine peptide SCIFF [Thermanaeromonas toyohensis ToBE]|uniref:Six-cysteine peptide SCIFF n=1 Tax=Thermanaeromonas toyohensis ToBE TaxID=698762 RepID=A0A1W1V6M4_9FIRM|nr:six-cysteine ranthipeptide SCIFF [Thermanaeromonas toyohensis]SMB88973.1 six-cysteine peptide SCIFF [Thermanaeromonas toyohensis ToBE]
MHILTIVQPRLQDTLAKGGCGNCHVSCQSACKTSITVSHQPCEREKQQ